MAIQLDELRDPGFSDGLDIHVIPVRIPVERRPAHQQFRMLVRASGIPLFLIGIITSIRYFSDGGLWIGLFLALMAFVPAFALWMLENSARSHFEALQQSINQAASQVDIYISKRVTLMKSLARTVGMGMEQELNVMLETVKARSNGDTDVDRNETSKALNKFFAVVEAYPEIKSNQLILKLMNQDETLMSEITAARVLYNDKVGTWNREIFEWPIKQIVAAECGYTTRISFIAPSDAKGRNEESNF